MHLAIAAIGTKHGHSTPATSTTRGDARAIANCVPPHLAALEYNQYNQCVRMGSGARALYVCVRALCVIGNVRAQKYQLVRVGSGTGLRCVVLNTCRSSFMPLPPGATTLAMRSCGFHCSMSLPVEGLWLPGTGLK